MSISAENMWWCFVYVCAFSFHRSVLLCFLPLPSMLYSYVCCCYSVTKLCPTPCNPMDCSLTGSSIHGISQARILKQVAISFSRGSSGRRDQTQVTQGSNLSLLHWQVILYHWAMRAAQNLDTQNTIRFMMWCNRKLRVPPSKYSCQIIDLSLIKPSKSATSV